MGKKVAKAHKGNEPVQGRGSRVMYGMVVLASIGVAGLGMYLSKESVITRNEINEHPSSAKNDAPVNEVVVSGYVPEYRLHHVKEHVASFGKVLDEVILFSVHPGVDGSVKSDPGMPIADLSFAKVAKQHGISSVLLSVGGGGRSSYFPNVVKKKDRRERLVKSLLKLCEEYELGGIDIDWEVPSSPEEKKGLVTLLKELKEALNLAGLRLTVALHYWDQLGKDIHQHVDRINFMTYDFQGTPDGHHSFIGTEKTIKAMISSGVPASKIAMGVPVYGRSASDVKTYSEIRASSPSLKDEKNKFKGFSFNGRALCRKKAKLAKDLGLGGVFVWEVGQDTTDKETSLLGALHDGLRS
eukprot:TRINITY_DN299_c0_g1_i2.p1 TRINITY_DN299_c0_g1~~TRINITY_DN299_c0_g1_i2.p1  ORF type:complete len:355 (+),score=68.94 TRINITY_DN299_c0_g1_i2:39-1103(+)